MSVAKSANSVEKFCIIGAGIVGQLTALEFLDRGWPPGIILESSAPAASLAGGGILSPMFPWRYTRELNVLAEPGCEAYAALVDRLSSERCLDGAEFYRSGIWMELQPEEALLFSRWQEYTSQEYVIEKRMVSGTLRSGVSFPLLGSISSPDIMSGLRQYLTACGVRFLKGEVINWLPEDECVKVCLREGTSLACKTLVVAAGAGARQLLPTPMKQFPAKGEMLMYRLGDEAPKELLLCREGYVIPRSNGDTVVGSTLRRDDDSSCPTVAGRFQLEQMAEALLPQCRGRKPDLHWAGIRPGLDRDYPYIGSVPGERDVFAAVGHYRNGLVCAPATARLLADVIFGNRGLLEAGDYSLSSSRSSSSFLSR